MSGVSGDFSKLAALRAALRKVPVMVAQKVAARAAPILTGLARASFDAGTTVYGDARPTGVDGNTLTLRKTGRTAGSLRFVSIGTITRCALGTPWAKYLIRYGLLPNGKAAIPVSWARALKAEAVRAITAELPQ